MNPLAAGPIWSICEAAATLGMWWGIDRITRVRVGEADEEAGLDDALPGEKAYLEQV